MRNKISFELGETELKDSVISIKRVTKVVKGGKKHELQCSCCCR